MTCNFANAFIYSIAKHNYKRIFFLYLHCHLTPKQKHLLEQMLVLLFIKVPLKTTKIKIKISQFFDGAEMIIIQEKI